MAAETSTTERCRPKKSEGKTRKQGKILRSKIIYKGPIFGVRRDEVLEPAACARRARSSRIPAR